MATYTTHYNLKKPSGSEKVQISDINNNMDTLDSTIYDASTAQTNSIIKCNTAISIPASGSSVSKSITGLTANHEVIRWNFSSSAENYPPCSLTITTGAGYFTLTNNGDTSTETIKPTFALPTLKTAANA